MDDDVFVNSEDEGFGEDPFVSSGSSTPSNSTDDEGEQSSHALRLLRRRDDDAEDVEMCHVRLGRRLGAGGFGRVYEGELHLAGRRWRRVAVKLARRRSGSSGLVRSSTDDSFLAESELAGLTHPNVVSVLAAGFTSELPSDFTRSTETSPLNMVPAIVMELAGHHNLQSIIDDSSQTLSLRRRLRYACDVTSALGYIHRQRIVHLDLKPSNIIVTETDRCKLADFGCSQRLPVMVDDEQVLLGTRRPLHSLPRAGAPKLNGTFAYRAPELLRSGPVTPAADVYSLGITLWQLRSRSLPYAGRDCHAIVFAVVAYHDRPDTSPTLRRCRRSTSSSRHLPASSVNRSDVTRTPEHRYRNVYQHCWDADAMTRPKTGELLEQFEMWLTELGCGGGSSTSSVDLDDD